VTLVALETALLTYLLTKVVLVACQSSKSRHLRYLFFSDRKLPLSLALFLNSALALLCLPYWVWFLGIDKFCVGEQAFI